MDDDKSLHRKYRPKKFEDVLGNKGVIDSLRSVLDRDSNKPHAFLFTGPSGCGKTTLARIMKDLLNVKTDQDFHELDAAQIGGVNTMRELRQSVGYFPLSGGNAVYLLDEAHRLSKEAQNALLKLLEDTPDHIFFILCTTDPANLINTIKTRCHTYNLSPLMRGEMDTLIRRVLNSEKVKIPDDAIKEIIKAADGSPRQALVILDSVIDIQNDDELLEAIINYNVREKTVQDLCKALLETHKWKDVAKVIQGIKEDPEKVRYAVMGYMETILLKDVNKRAVLILNEFANVNFMYSGRPGLTLSCFSLTAVDK